MLSNLNLRHYSKWFGESDCGGMDGPLQQLLSKDVNPEMRAKVTQSLADRPRVNLAVTAAAATAGEDPVLTWQPTIGPVLTWPPASGMALYPAKPSTHSRASPPKQM